NPPDPKVGLPPADGAAVSSPEASTSTTDVVEEDANASLDERVLGSTKQGKRRTNIKTFDFRRPSKFSRDHFRAFQIVHETFSRQLTTVLSTSLRTMCQVTLDEVEQLSYGEYVQELPNPSFLAIFQLDPLPGASMIFIPLPLVMNCIEFLLGG